MSTSGGASAGVSRRTVAALCLTELVALGALAVPAVVGLAIQVRSIDHGFASDEAALSLIAVCGAVTAMAANPVFGWLSDRTRTAQRPHRTPWILGGVLAAAVGAPTVYLIDSLLGLVLFWCFLQLAYNPTIAAVYGTIADVVPEAERSRVAGLFAASVTGSAVLALGLVAVLPKTTGVLFVMMPLIAVPVAIWSSRHLRTVAPVHDPVPSAPGAPAVRSLLRASSQYWWVWTQRLLTQFAHSIVLMFGVFYLIRRVGLGEERAATWVAFSAAGRLANRRGSYGPYLVVGIGLIVVALAIKAVATSAIVYHIATLLVGIGIGCYYAVDLALVLRTIPSRSAGAFLGFFNIARTLPQSLAPALAPFVLGLGTGDLVGVDRSQNYFALYSFGLAMAVAALLLLIPIKVLRRSDVPGPPRRAETG